MSLFGQNINKKQQFDKKKQYMHQVITDIQTIDEYSTKVKYTTPIENCKTIKTLILKHVFISNKNFLLSAEIK